MKIKIRSIPFCILQQVTPATVNERGGVFALLVGNLKTDIHVSILQ